MSPIDLDGEWREFEEHAGSSSINQPLRGMKAQQYIFFILPYWIFLKVAHMLDPIHIFKNIGEKLWRHLIGDKDTLTTNIRDLQIANMKPTI